jgi:hypothetical protein
MLRPLQCLLNFFPQFGGDVAREGGLQRHDGLLAALLRLRHAQRGDALPEVRLGVAGVQLGGEACIEPRLKKRV